MDVFEFWKLRGIPLLCQNPLFRTTQPIPVISFHFSKLVFKKHVTFTYRFWLKLITTQASNPHPEMSCGLKCARSSGYSHSYESIYIYIMYVRRDGSKFLRPLNVLAFLIVLPQLCSTNHDDLLFKNTAVYRVEFVLDQQDIHAVFIDLRLLTGSFQLKARHDNYWYFKNHCPRRPVSIWQKHGYVCLFLPADDLTICMDILPNPGPVSPISSPRNYSVYKLGGKNLHVRPNHIQYSRSALLKLRPCGNHVSNLGWNTLSYSLELLSQIQSANAKSTAAGAEIKSAKEEVSKLQQNLEKSKQDIEEIAQYLRRDCVEISGVLPSLNHSCEEIVTGYSI